MSLDKVPRQMAVEQVKREFDRVLNAGTKRSRKRNLEEQVELDKKIVEFMHKMKKAVEKDAEMHRKKLPAAYRYELLPQLLAMMSNADLCYPLLDNRILDGIRAWLEPFDDGMLSDPSLRTDILRALQNFPVDKLHLKESGLGRIVMYLFKSADETDENRQLASRLIDSWSRPIVGNSSDYRDLANLADPKPRKSIIRTQRPRARQGRSRPTDRCI